MTNVQIQTSKGNINLKLFDDDAPMTVASFLFLIRKGFYNGLTFHRCIDNFMIQGGCPLGTGTGGPMNKGIDKFPYKGGMVKYPFSDEFHNGHLFDKPGILAMANAGPNTNGSQFFITHVVTDWLNNKHTIFGEVMGPEDQKVVNAIKKGDKIQKIKIL
ncbi:MAG: peptidylprolyl isomerase [Candidatus Lokiarchaeota archaeon]|nr:peptidylprolyl isomerase [Candidatus Lokiarchaeota archaeon]